MAMFRHVYDTAHGCPHAKKIWFGFECAFGAQPARGAAAACFACDECLTVAVDGITDEALDHSVHVAEDRIKEAIEKTKPPGLPVSPRSGVKMSKSGYL